MEDNIEFVRRNENSIADALARQSRFAARISIDVEHSTWLIDELSFVYNSLDR